MSLLDNDFTVDAWGTPPGTMPKFGSKSIEATGIKPSAYYTLTTIDDVDILVPCINVKNEWTTHVAITREGKKLTLYIQMARARRRWRNLVKAWKQSGYGKGYKIVINVGGKAGY